MDKLDYDYIALEAQRRMAQKKLDQYLDDHRHEQAGEQQQFLEIHTARLDVLLRLYRVRKRTPPNYDDYRAMTGAFYQPLPEPTVVVDIPKPKPAAPAPAMGDLPMFKKKGGRRKK